MAVVADARRGRRARVGRAVAASSVATVVASASHVAAGGAVPPLLGVAAVLVVSWLPAVVVAGRRTSPVGLALLIGLSEFAFHAVFDVLAVGTSASHLPALRGMSAMPGMPAMTAARLSAVPMGDAASGAMWSAHVAAAAVTWLAWWRGEAALRRVLRAVARLAVALLPCPLGPQGAVDRPPVLDPRADGARARGPVLLAAHPRRGPPVSMSSI